MKRSITVAAVAALTLLTACGPERAELTSQPIAPSTTPAAPSASAIPSASPSAGPSKTPPAAPAPSRPQRAPEQGFLLTPDGIGPYVIGTRLRPALAVNPSPVSSECRNVVHHDATGRYAGVLELLVKDGVLVEIHTSARSHTREGAQVGEPLSEVTRIYGARAKTWRGEGGVPVAAITIGPNSIVFAGSFEQPHTVRTVHIGRTDVATQHVSDPWPCV